MGAKAVSMAISNWQMNRFERVLFGVALAIALLIVLVRIAAMILVWYSRYHH
jgi:hypothetical protein